MHPLPTTCPICTGALCVTRLECEECDVAIEGKFTLGWLGHLNRDQLEFVELLVKNRGNINGVASNLKVAYNTARSRLDDIVTALGYGVPLDGHRTDRRTVLDRLASKEISVEEAMKLLKT